MKLILLTVLLGICVAEETESTDVCFLLDGDQSTKPFPSLTQCYKNNQESCCVSAHDATIEGSYGGLLSATCLREYQELEHYFCLGCNPKMFNYIHWYNASSGCYDTSNGGVCSFNNYQCDTSTCGVAGTHGWEKDGKLGMIKVCDDFLKKLLYGDADKCSIDSDSCTIDKYDNCGLNLVVDGFGDDAVGWYPSAYFVDAAGKQDPMKFLTDIRPPYFQDLFHISIGEYSDSNSKYEAFKAGRYVESSCTANTCADADNCDCEPEAGFPYFEKWSQPDNAPDAYDPKSCFSAASSVHMSMLAVLAGFAALVVQFM